MSAFYTAIRAEHGEAGAQFCDLLRSGEADGRLWSAKNATLELSLDVNWLFSGDLYERQLPLLAKWLRERGGVRRVLDVGCDAGMITCFLALISPAAEVVGIDRCVNAIENADALARRCEAFNARFETLDFDDVAGTISGGNFDLIVASRVLIAPEESRAPEAWTLADAEAAPPDHLVLRTALLNRSQRAGGWLWALERLPYHLDVARFIGALKQADYTPAPQNCLLLQSTEATGRQEMPVIIAENKRGSVSVYEVLEHLKRTPARPRLNKTYVGSDADVLFNKLGLRSLVYACELFDGVRIEIWWCVEGVADYRRRDDGGRQLKLLPENREERRWPRYEILLKHLAASRTGRTTLAFRARIGSERFPRRSARDHRLCCLRQSPSTETSTYGRSGGSASTFARGSRFIVSRISGSDFPGM